MKKFSVMSRTEAKRFTFKEIKEKTVIVSITDVFSQYNSFNKQSNLIGVCHVKFDDVERGELNCITEKDAEKIIKFVKEHEDAEHIVVHCEAGVSRSAGACAALMMIYNGNDMEIFENPKYCPNMTVYRTILNKNFEIENDGVVPKSVFENLENEVVEKTKINVDVWCKANDI